MAACTAVSRGRRLAPLYRSLPLADSAPCDGPLAGLMAVAVFMALSTWLMQGELYGDSFRMGLSCVVELALVGRDGTGTFGVRMFVLCVLHPFTGAAAVPMSVLGEHMVGPAAAVVDLSRRLLLQCAVFVVLVSMTLMWGVLSAAPDRSHGGRSGRANRACPYCRCKFKTLVEVSEHILLEHADDHAANQATIQQFQQKIHELLEQDQIFSSIFDFALTLTGQGQECTPDGACSIHARGSDACCVIPDNILEGLQILQRDAPPDEEFTLQCIKSQSVHGDVHVTKLQLTSNTDTCAEIYVRLGQILVNDSQAREKAKSLQTELNNDDTYSPTVVSCARYMENCQELSQLLKPSCAIEHGRQGRRRAVFESVKNPVVRDLFKPRQPLLFVLRTKQQDFHNMCRTLGVSTAITKARQVGNTACKYAYDAAARARKQAATKQSKAVQDLATQNRSWTKQTPSRAAYETAEAYCQRRFQELQSNPNPQLSDVVDYENNPAAALVLFYLKSNLETRHEPPACFTTDIFMLHGCNLYDFEKWSDMDINVIRAYSQLGTIVQQAQWLRIVAECRHILKLRRDSMGLPSHPMHLDIQDASIHDDVNLQDDMEDEYLSHDISESMYALYVALCIKFQKSIMMWCTDVLECDDVNDMPIENETNTTQHLCQQHRLFQQSLACYITSLQLDPSNMDIEGTREWPRTICAEMLDGEIMANLIPVCTALSNQPQHHHFIIDNHTMLVSSEVLRHMCVDCIYRYAEITFANVTHNNNISQDVPHIRLNSDTVVLEQAAGEINLPIMDMIECEEQTCLAVLQDHGSSILIGSMLVIQAGKTRQLHVRVTNVDRFPRINDVPNHVLRRHGMSAGGVAGQTHLRLCLSQLYAKLVQDTTPVHIIYFTPCMSNDNAYARPQSTLQSVTDYVDHVVAEKTNLQPCIQHQRVVSLIKITEEIRQAYVSTSEKQDLMDQYHARIGNNLQLISCACCGVRGLESDTDHGFVQMTFPEGFPFENDLYKTTGAGHCPCSYVVYPLNGTTRQRSIRVKAAEAGAMYERLRMDVDRVALNEADREHRYFQSLSQDVHLDQTELNRVQQARKKIRDGLDRPDWDLSDEDLARYRLEQCIRSRYWDNKTAAYYALHPELVQADLHSSVVILDMCAKCRHQVVQPTDKDMPREWYALCNGYQFPWIDRAEQLPPPNDGFSDVRENLPPLNLIEQMIVAKVRILCPIFKFTVKVFHGKSMRVAGHVGKGHKTMVLQGQCVAMENIHMKVNVQAQHGEPLSSEEPLEMEEIEWKMLSAEDISNRVNVYFMVEGSNGEQKKDHLAQLMLNGEQLKVNRKHLLRHLHFHYRNTPGYQDRSQMSTIERDETWQEFVHEYRTNVAKNMYVETEQSLKQTEEQLTSDITGGHQGPEPLFTENVRDGQTNDSDTRSDIAANDDVMITGADPPPQVDASPDPDACVFCGDNDQDNMLTCMQCGMSTHVHCYFNSGSKDANDSISLTDAWKCGQCGGPETHHVSMLSCEPRILSHNDAHADMESDSDQEIPLRPRNTTRRRRSEAESETIHSQDLPHQPSQDPVHSSRETHVILNHVQVTQVPSTNEKRSDKLAGVARFLKENGHLDTADVPGDGESLHSPTSEDDSDGSDANGNDRRAPAPQTATDRNGVNDENGEPPAPVHSSLRAAEIMLTRTNELMQSKYSTDKIMYGGFPNQFPLASGLHNHKDGLTVSLQKHLMSQFTTAFASNTHLLFYVFNRHIVSLNNNSAHVALKDRPETSEWFGRYIADPQFLQKARNAARNPHSTEAEEVLRVVNPFLKMTGEKMPFSDAEKQQFETQTYAMFHRFKEPSYLVTVSPNSNALSFRFSTPTRARGTFPETTSVHPSGSGRPACDMGHLFEKNETADIPMRGRYTTDERGEIRMDIPIPQRSEAFNFSTINLIKFATEHPAGCVEMFRRMLEAVLEILIGLPTTFSTGRKTIFKSQVEGTKLMEPKLRHKGILGYPRAAAGVIENSGRDALHSHLIVWTVLSPMVIQAAAANKPVMRLIAKVIESHMFAHIPPEYHIRDCLTKMLVYEKRLALPRFGARNAPDIGRATSPSSDYQNSLYEFCGRCQIHTHHPTCHKGAIGCIMCRMARGQATCERTAPVEIDTSVLPQYWDNKTKKMRFTTDSFTLQRERRWVPTLKPTVTLPKSSNRRDVDLPEPARRCGPLHVDKRVIQVDLIRPKLDTVPNEDIEKQIMQFCTDHDLDMHKDFVHLSDSKEDTLKLMLESLRKKLCVRNGLVVETNDVLAMCTQSQSNVQWLNSAINSRNALQYMTSYLSKRKVSISSTFALMGSVRKQILSRAFQSREEDVGSNTRTAKHFLARFHNMLMKKMEISAAQTAQCLLQVPVFYVSESFRKCFFTVAHDYLIQNRAKSAYYTELDGQQYNTFAASDASDRGDSDGDTEDRENPQMDTQAHTDTSRERSKTGYGLCPTYAIPPEVEIVDPNSGLSFRNRKHNLAVPQHINYDFRGNDLRMLTFLEYVSLVDGPRKMDENRQNDTERKPTGLKWKRVGTVRPDGHEIRNAELQRSLQDVSDMKTFTRQEWSTLDVADLSWDSYVHVSDAYFMPVPTVKPSGLYWKNVGDQRPAGEEITNLQLQNALQGVKYVKSFTKHQWERLDIDNVHWKSFVHSYGSYFKPVGPSRKTSPFFAFDKEHPFNVHNCPYSQVLYSLQHTPIIAGKLPPALPNANEQSSNQAKKQRQLNKKLDEFGKYYLILFAPWDNVRYGPDRPLNFEGFVEYVSFLDTSTCVWDRGRLAMMQAMIDCQTLNKTIRTILSAYRSRAATRWDEQDEENTFRDTTGLDSDWTGPMDAAVDFSEGHDAFAAEFEERLEECADKMDNTFKLIETSRKQMDFLHNRRHWLTQTREFVAEHNQTANMDSDVQEASESLGMPSLVYTRPGHRRNNASYAQACKDVLDEIMRTDNNKNPFTAACAQQHEDGENSVNDAGNNGAMANLHNQAENMPVQRGPHPANEEQQHFLDTVMESVSRRQEYFNHARQCNDVELQSLPNPLIFLHGGPGVGKTNVIQHIQRLCKVACSASTGVAASLIPGASTTHKRHNVTFGADKKNDWKATRVDGQGAMIKELLDCDVYLIDEISMLSAIMVGKIDQHMRNVRSLDEKNGHVFKQLSFGGIVVVMVGDFFQIPPVRADALYTSVMKQLRDPRSKTHSAETPLDRGVSLFQTFQLVQLTQQQRLQTRTENAGDVTHNQMLKRFRTERNPLDSDAMMNYLEARQVPESPRDATDLNQMTDPAWKWATYIFTNNAQRYDYNYTQAVHWAQDNNMPLLWWPCNVKRGTLNDLGVEDQEYLFENSPVLKDVFVARAPCFLTNQLSPQKGLANGSRGWLHSLVFNNPYDRHREREKHRTYEQEKKEVIRTIARAENRFSVIRLSLRPSYVNVLIKSSNAGPWAHASLQHDEGSEFGLIPIEVKKSVHIDMISKQANDTNETPVTSKDDKRILIPGFVSRQCGSAGEISKRIPPRHVCPEPSVYYELGFAITSHKAQGCTLEHVIIDLSQNPFMPWDLFMLHVALSRVRSSNHLRVLPFVEPKESWSRRLRNLKFPADLMAFLYSYDENGICCPTRALAWSDNASKDDPKKKTSQSNVSAGQRSVSRAPRNIRQLRSIPDPCANLSFVNSAIFCLYPIYESHLIPWGANCGNRWQPVFDTFMTACLAPRKHGEKAYVAQTIHQQFCGKLGQNNVYSNIADMVPSFGDYHEQMDTPVPSAFFKALAQHLEWNLSLDTQCNVCSRNRTSNVPRIPIFQMYASASEFPDGCDVQEWIAKQIQCEKCQGVSIVDDPADVWETIDVICIDISRPHGVQSPGAKVSPTSRIRIGDYDFNLVSVSYEAKHKKRKAWTVKKYDAAVRMPPFDANSDWFHTLATNASSTSSFKKIQDDTHFHYHTHLLVYVRAKNDSPGKFDHLLIQEGQLFMYDKFVCAVQHVEHYDKFIVHNCQQVQYTLSRVQILRGIHVLFENMTTVHDVGAYVACACGRPCYQKFSASGNFNPDFENRYANTKKPSALNSPSLSSIPKTRNNTSGTSSKPCIMTAPRPPDMQLRLQCVEGGYQYAQFSTFTLQVQPTVQIRQVWNTCLGRIGFRQGDPCTIPDTDGTEGFLLFSNSSQTPLDLALLCSVVGNNAVILVRVSSFRQRAGSSHFPGLVNEGNTCYANSIFQAFVSCPQMMGFLQRKPADAGERKYARLQSVLSKLIRNAGTINAHINTFVDMRLFPIPTQHCPAQFLEYILRGSFQTNGILPENYYQAHISCSGHFTRQAQCLTCRHVWHTHDPDMPFLPIPAGDGRQNISEAVQNQFTTTAQALDCSQCDSRQECRHCVTFTCGPVLFIQILSGDRNVELESTNKKTSFPVITDQLTISLPRLHGEPQIETYQIRAVICHRGNTLNRGHFVTYGKRKVSTGQDTWFLFNDDNTTETTFSEAILTVEESDRPAHKAQTPYLVCYERM